MFFSKQNYMGVYHYCLKTEILNLGLLGVFDSCRQSSSLWFQSLLAFMKEFSSSKCIRSLWLYNDTFTLTEENLMNSSKSVKLRPYRSKNTSSRCQTWALWLLIWCSVPFALGINMMLKLGLSTLPVRLDPGNIDGVQIREFQATHLVKDVIVLRNQNLWDGAGKGLCD